jgi:SacI-like restriction endonuclease
LGIRIPTRELELTLERAVVLAESGSPLPEIWTERVERLERCPSKTYVAALGTALLAKATADDVDVLTIKSKAGSNAYSMRGVVKTLVEKAPTYGYHLGVTGPEPLNNQPWFGADRVDRISNLRRDVVEYHREMVRYLSDLNGSSSEDALKALAAFIRRRQTFAREEIGKNHEQIVLGAGRVEDILEVLTIFLHGKTEGGRTGQALVASVLDLAHEDVRLAPINDPSSIDVSVWRESRMILAVEVKQKAVGESAALHLAEEASARGADKAMLVAIAPDQPRLDHERVRRQSEAAHGVATAVATSIVDLVTTVVIHSGLAASEFAVRLPDTYLGRMRQHGVSDEMQRYWLDLCATLPS